MKYTKDFEKYWKRINRTDYYLLEFPNFELLKQITFKAWKAGQRKTKKEYNEYLPSIYKR